VKVLSRLPFGTYGEIDDHLKYKIRDRDHRTWYWDPSHLATFQDDHLLDVATTTLLVHRIQSDSTARLCR